MSVFLREKQKHKVCMYVCAGVKEEVRRTVCESEYHCCVLWKI